MPSIISMPVASFHSLRVAAGSASPADTHFTSDDRSCFFASARHRAVGRRRGEQHAGAMLGDRRQQHVRRRPLDQQRRGADRQREQQQPAQPERERERRAAGEEIVGRRAQRRPRPAVADRDDVAMKMHRALRLAGRARREGDQRRVVGGRVDVGERRRLARRPRLERVGIAAAEHRHRREHRTVRAARPRARRQGARRISRARSPPW